MKTLIHRFLLIVLLLSQFAITVHAYEHDAAHETTQDCELCVQLLNGKYGIAADTSFSISNLGVDESIATIIDVYYPAFGQQPRNKSPPFS